MTRPWAPGDGARATVGLGLALAALLGCSPEERPTVFVAASLGDAMREAAARYEAERGERVRVVAAGSHVLRRQIEAGAPADLFVPADAAHVRAESLAPWIEEARPLVCNRLVMLVPESSELRTLHDLAGAERVVLGTPEVPVGAYAARVLARAEGRYGAGWRAGVEGHVRSRELDVRQVVSKVLLGEADAAIVYATDVRPGVRAIAIEAALDEVARYPLAVLRGASPGARAFGAWLAGPGRAALTDRGFAECP